MYEIRPITDLRLDELQLLLDESLQEGFGFIERLWQDYASGANRFATDGAILLGVYDDDRLIGIGGVHPDPYLNRPDVGRIRHVYILSAYRRRGVGKLLMEALITHARTHFDLLTLRTLTPSAAAFYEALGFDNQPTVAEATHTLRLKPTRAAQPPNIS